MLLWARGAESVPMFVLGAGELAMREAWVNVAFEGAPDSCSESLVRMVFALGERLETRLVECGMVRIRAGCGERL